MAEQDQLDKDEYNFSYDLGDTETNSNVLNNVLDKLAELSDKVTQQAQQIKELEKENRTTLRLNTVCNSILLNCAIRNLILFLLTETGCFSLRCGQEWPS